MGFATEINTIASNIDIIKTVLSKTVATQEVPVKMPNVPPYSVSEDGMNAFSFFNI